MLSASQWTSKNLVVNCVGIEGPTGPVGPDGPYGPEGDNGIFGPSGPDGPTNIGETGPDGFIGEMGPELPLYVRMIDCTTSQTFNLSLYNKYETFIIYLFNDAGSPSPVETTNIRFQASSDLSSYTNSDYWIRIKFFNYTLAYGSSQSILVNILLNGSSTPAARFKVYPAWVNPASNQTMYIRWNTSGHTSSLGIY